MIIFNYETTFSLSYEEKLQSWISSTILDKGFKLGEINFIFCDDVYLHKLNVEFLQHDTLTDVISFDNTLGSLIAGDIFISIDRIKENAIDFKTSFNNELHRVMIHGVLHFLGFKDKLPSDKSLMTEAENNALKLLNI
ncbi:rRNA maturation RNase YbeY [uncultured Polaribacter sp.]|uniref:rRNA maturation RNase YbeY n=1 Tax=uncultured Polaribacter sp. TaxID=174711 RepID=UPI0026143314|nr:rRNA maturation RNase YbeY [uncultured Polaribacter sp.]